MLISLVILQTIIIVFLLFWISKQQKLLMYYKIEQFNRNVIQDLESANYETHTQQRMLQ